MGTQRDDRERKIISEQAAQWVCDLRENGKDEQIELLNWLKRSPDHVAEFLFAATIWKEVREIGVQDSTDLEALTAQALAREPGINVLRLNNDAQTSVPHPGKTQRGIHNFTTAARWRWAAGFAMLAVTAALAGWIFGNGSTYTTAIGEQRTVRLTDGSLLHLNTHSRIQVRFSEHVRAVRLLDGEALFTVQRDTDRPFRVESADTVLQAVGPQFNVYRRGEQTKVSVIEGRVRIVDRDALPTPATSPQLLDAGEEVSIAPGRPIAKRKNADIAGALAWRERMLIFRGEKLQDVATEFNRYNQRRIHVEGDTARNKLLSGTFRADDPGSLILFLDRLEDLNVQSRENEFVITER